MSWGDSDTNPSLFASQALAVIEENMTLVMTHAPPSFQAKALFLRARCHAATSAKYGDDVAKRTSSFKSGRVHFEGALEEDLNQ